jgi:hypothetical protein
MENRGRLDYYLHIDQLNKGVLETLKHGKLQECERQLLGLEQQLEMRQQNGERTLLLAVSRLNVYNSLCVLYKQRTRYERMMGLLKKIVQIGREFELEPVENAVTLMNISCVLSLMHKSDQAITVAQRAKGLLNKVLLERMRHETEDDREGPVKTKELKRVYLNLILNSFNLSIYYLKSGNNIEYKKHLNLAKSVAIQRFGLKDKVTQLVAQDPLIKNDAKDIKPFYCSQQIDINKAIGTGEKSTRRPLLRNIRDVMDDETRKLDRFLDMATEGDQFGSGVNQRPESTTRKNASRKFEMPPREQSRYSSLDHSKTRLPKISSNPNELSFHKKGREYTKESSKRVLNEPLIPDVMNVSQEVEPERLPKLNSKTKKPPTGLVDTMTLGQLKTLVKKKPKPAETDYHPDAVRVTPNIGDIIQEGGIIINPNKQLKRKVEEEEEVEEEPDGPKLSNIELLFNKKYRIQNQGMGIDPEIDSEHQRGALTKERKGDFDVDLRRLNVSLRYMA